MAVKTDIPEKLVTLGLLTHDEIKTITREAESAGLSFQRALVKLGLMSEDRVLEFLAHVYGVEAVNPLAAEIPQSVIKLISPEIALKFKVLPVYKHGRTLALAMTDPTDIYAIDDLKFITGLEIKPMVATEIALAGFRYTAQHSEKGGLSRSIRSDDAD